MTMPARESRSDELMFSIVVTAYNIEQYVVECLESIRTQSYTNYEVLVVDDGSTDRTLEIVKRYCESDDKFQWYSQQNSGVSVARNRGIDWAKGDYVIFVDGDDYLDPDAVEFFSRNLCDETDILCSCCHAFDESHVFEDHFFDDSYSMKTIRDKERLYLQLLNGNIGKPNGKGATAVGVPWGKAYRNDFLKRNDLRFNPALKRMQDNVFNSYAFLFAKRIDYIDEAHYNYRLNHIQSRGTMYSPQIWASVLEAREQFFCSHPEVLSENVSMQRIYEKYVGFVASAVFVSKTMGFKEARNNLAALCKESVFAEVLCWERHSWMPSRFVFVKTLALLKLYDLLILGFKLI